MVQLGCDVSFWQGIMNWLIAVRAGIQFAFIKCTDGTTIIDPQFKVNWSGTYGKLPRGAYHFFRTNLDPIQQAKLFVETVWCLQMGWGELSLVVDVEDKGTVALMAARAANALHLSHPGLPYLMDRDRDGDLDLITTVKPTVEQKVKLFTDYVSTHTNGEPVMIYTSPSYITTYFKSPIWSQYPLWIANYCRTTPSVPEPWIPGLEKYWQIGQGDGAFYGAQSKRIDLNIGRG
jgi:lysozyme